jgi:hypothetical protein
MGDLSIVEIRSREHDVLDAGLQEGLPVHGYAAWG